MNRPASITAIAGSTAATNGAPVAVLLPWWPTLRNPRRDGPARGEHPAPGRGAGIAGEQERLRAEDEPEDDRGLVQVRAGTAGGLSTVTVTLAGSSARVSPAIAASVGIAWVERYVRRFVAVWVEVSDRAGKIRDFCTVLHYDFHPAYLQEGYR